MPESIRNFSSFLSTSVIDRLPFFIVAFATLMLVTLSYLAVDSSVRLVRESLISRSLAAVNTVSNQLNSELFSYTSLIGSESSSPLIRNALADSEGLQSYLRPHMLALIQGYEAITSITLIDGSGTSVVAVKKSTSEPDDSIMDQARLLDVIKHGKPAYFLTGNTLLTLDWPVWFPPTGKHEGVLRVNFDLIKIVESATQPINENSSAKISMRFIAADQPMLHDPGHDSYIPGDEFIFSKRFQLPAPFLLHQSAFEYHYKSTQEREAVIRTIWLHAFSTLIAWLIFYIFAKWINVRYVEPIRKITAIASSFARPVGQEHFEEDGGTIEKLQNSVQSVINILNTTEHSYQKKIQFTAIELNQTKEKLEEIARSGKIIALSVDLQTGLINYCTQLLSEYIKKNKSYKNNPSKNWRAAYRLIAREDRLKLNQSIRTCLRFGFSRLSVKAKIDDRDFIFDLRLQKSASGPGNVYCIDGIALDNTEMAAKERELIQSEERKSAIINGAPDGFIALTPDFLVTEVNPAAERMLGRKNIALLGLRFVDHCIAPSSVQRFIKFSQQLLDSKIGYLRYQGETIWCRDAHDQNIPVDLNGTLINTPSGLQICLYMQNLQKTYQQQRAIAEKTAEVNTILDLSPGGFASFNAIGELSAHSGSLQEMLNLDSRGFAEKCLARNEFEELLNQLMIKEPNKHLIKPESPEEKILRFMEPKEKLLKCTRRYLQPLDSSASCVYYFTDITQEFQLTTLKNNFLATAAHELRTPLTTIMGFSEFLSTQDASPEEKNELMGSIFRNSRQLSALIDDLLDLSKIDSEGANIYKPKFIDLARSLKRLINESSSQRNNKRFIQDHEISIAIAPLLTVIADEEKLMRAIQNIISNAAKYSPPRSPIEIIAIRDHKNGCEWVKVAVIDKGIGMTADEVAHAFVRFWRADSHSGKIPGTGLGLALVKEIVEMHQGLVEIDSQYKIGTTVSIFIPLASENQPDVPAVISKHS